MPEAQRDQVDAEGSWRGQRFGLPASGRRSIAGLGWRLLAIVIDWGIALLLSFAFASQHGRVDGFVTLAVFAVLQVLFSLLLGATPGHLVAGIRLVPINGGRLLWWQPIWRTLLLCVVVPVAIWDRDQRGLHDRWAGTMLVRSR